MGRRRATRPPSTPARPVNGASFVAPDKPGFYHLAIVRGLDRQIIAEPTLAVMVPFKQRVGGMLNGYRIGTYLADRLGHHDHPDGFLEVSSEDVDLRVSTHLRLGDFLTHDAQSDVWPKYVALNPRLLDKLELVLAKIGAHAALSRSRPIPRRTWHLTCTAASGHLRTTRAFFDRRVTAGISTATRPMWRSMRTVMAG